MKRLRWSDVERELAAIKVPRQPRPADEFWCEFRARAAAAIRTDQVPAPPVLDFPRWLAAAAAVVVVAGLVWLSVAGRHPEGNGGAGVGPQSVAILPEGNEINSVSVFVPSAGYVILSDKPGDGVILLVADVDEEN